MMYLFLIILAVVVGIFLFATMEDWFESRLRHQKAGLPLPTYFEFLKWVFSREK